MSRVISFEARLSPRFFSVCFSTLPLELFCSATSAPTLASFHNFLSFFPRHICSLHLLHSRVFPSLQLSLSLVSSVFVCYGGSSVSLALLSGVLLAHVVVR